jgi:hypothetical protein
MALASDDSLMATPVPSMPCQRPNIVTPLGGAPPVSRNLATAALNELCGTDHRLMYFMKKSPKAGEMF